VSAGLPAVTQAVVNGELSVDHLDLFGVFATSQRCETMDRDQAFVVEQCRRVNFKNANQLLSYWAHAVDATDTSDRNENTEEPSSVYLSETFEGSW